MRFHEKNSPFNKEQADLLNRIVPALTEQQKIWLSGYLAGASQITGQQAGTAPGAHPAPATTKEITILYGSQTGNSRGLAKKAAAELEKHGFKTTVAAMNQFKPQKLKKVETLLIIVSTHGEGEPPDNAVSFHEFLHSKRAPKLEHLQFSVLGLGDSSYEFFCQTGKDFDRRLEELGGTRLHPRADCDLDFEGPAAKWLAGVINALKKQELIEVAPAAAALETAPQTTSAYSRSNPFRAEVLENINLNGRGSNKETRHIELSLEGSGLAYQPGDCLGIYPENDPELVERILDELDWNPNESVTINEQGDILSFKEALTTQYEITVLSKPLLEKIAQITGNAALRDLVATEHKLKEYVYGRDLLDLIRDFGRWGGTPQEFVSVLRKMPPRLYSISSSLAANPDEVHVTVGVVRYTAHGRQRKGVCSNFCAERLQPGVTVPVFIQENDSFRLPDDPDTPIIMIGPGTGVAPFRAFMQEREEQGAAGKSWLFFGEQHFMTDFLYQTEWKQWLESGVLTKLDVAFSRDRKEKIYVQHRMQENSRELFRWLEDGAVLYVCGDEKRMAKDVHETLIRIIEKEGGLSREQAEEYVANLAAENRYRRDVY